MDAGDRAAQSSPPLYRFRPGDPDPVVRPSGRPEDADGHLSRHPHPGDCRGVDLSRSAAGGHVRAGDLLLRAAAELERQRHRTHREPVAAGRRHRQDLLPAGRRYPHCDRAGDQPIADGPQADAAGHHPAAYPQLQRLHRTDPAAGLVWRRPDRTEAVRSGSELHPSRSCIDPWRVCPLALRRQGAADPDRPRPAGAAVQGAVGAGRGRRARRAEPDHPRRHGQDRRLRIQHQAQQQPRHRSRIG